MEKKLTVDELLRLACICAESEREEFVAAHSHIPNDPAAEEARKYLKQLRAYRNKRWGRTGLEKMIDEAEPITVAEAIRRTKEAT